MDELADITSKDDLLQGIEKVDREIAQVEQQIINLKKAQVSSFVDYEFNYVDKIIIFFKDYVILKLNCSVTLAFSHVVY